MPLGLLGKKLGHTRVYNAAGNLIPVTVVLAGPNRVLQVKTQAGKDGYNSVQLGFDDQKEQRLTKPLLGHIKKHNGVAVKLATGGVLTTTVRVVVPVVPRLSVTVNVTVYVPAAAYVRLAVTPLPVDPSPKFHA